MTDLLTELRKPVDAVVDPPVQTSHQTLPFQQLTWQNFERLCLRLASAESDVRSANLFGVPGQRQYGIDLIAFPKDAPRKATWVYQCKQWKSVSAADVAEWVDLLLQSWQGPLPARFTICVSQALTSVDLVRQVSAERSKLDEQGVELKVWDAEELSHRLKQRPELVDDFFGRPWVNAFNGAEAAAGLSARMTSVDVAQLRRRLFSLYDRLFEQHDPGIAPPRARAVPLRHRYVWPDVIVERALPEPHSLDPSYSTPPVQTAGSTGNRQAEAHAAQALGPEAIRVPAVRWLVRQHRAIILGELGMGKSSLLRNMALDLLSPDTTAPDLTGAWGELTPVWIPFAGWVEAVERSGASLVDFVKDWLHRHSADDIAGLVERLMDDTRVLLLIDGLDERTSDHSARIALDLLEAFLANHDVPVIMTSRLVGYEAVARPGQEWTHAHLAPLSVEQQHALVHFWFRWLGGGADDPQAQAVADRESDSLLAEVGSRPELSGLSAVPLTLQMLVELRRRGVTIPQRRSQVYRKLIDCLLEEQPLHRRRAAGRETSPELDLTERRDLLASLALRLQVLGGAGALPEQECIEFITAILTDPGRPWGYDRVLARQLARSLIAYAVSEAGVLVRRLPDEIVFSHLGLQHWLAAYGLSLRRTEEQRQHVMQFCLDPRWREVVLSLLELRCATEEGRGFAMCVLDDLKAHAASAFARRRLDTLLAEAVFADLGLPSAYARTEAKRLLDLVGTSSFPDEAAVIVLAAISGLHSRTTGEVVEHEMSRWFPARSEWSRAAVLEQLGAWGAAPDVRQTLVGALYDEDSRCRATAGLSIAAVLRGDKVLVRELLQVARHSVVHGPREGALLALAFGWPDAPQLPDLLARSAQDGDQGVRLSAIEARIQLSLHTDEDRNALWSLGKENTSLDYGRRREVGPALLLGWPLCDDLRTDCLEALRRAGGYLHGQLIEQAAFVLLSGWPGDDEVAACFAGLLRQGRDPFSMMHLSGWTTVWDLLASSFRGHSILAPAVLEWLKQYPSWHFVRGGRPLVACGLDEAKQFALGCFPTKAGINTDANVAANLLTGWPDDDAVLARARDWVEDDPLHAESLADYLKLIYPDPRHRRELLLSRLRADRRRDPASVLRALLEEEVEWNPDELLEPALRNLDQVWQPIAQSVREILIRAFPSDPRSRDAAHALLLEPTAFFPAVVAEAYEHDHEFRPLALRAAACAPTAVRRLLVEQLSQRSTPPVPALRVLDSLRWEDDSLARASAAIGTVLQIEAIGASLDEPIEFFRGEAISVGPELDRRRPAGVAALLQAGKTAELAQYVSQSQMGNPFEEVFSILSPNVPALRLLAAQWSALKAGLSPDASATLGIGEDRFWEVMSSWVEEFPDLRSDFETHAEIACQRPLAAATLTAVANVMPQSRVLREACLSTLKAVEENRFCLSRGVAARLIGSHFGGQDAVLGDLVGIDASGQNWAVTLALLLGWPASEPCRRRVDSIRNQPMPWLLYLHLARVLKEPTRLVEGGAEYVTQCANGAVYPDPEAVHAIELGIRESESVRCGIRSWLSRGPDLAVTAASLLRGAEVISADLRDELSCILDRESTESVPPVVGYDLVTGLRRSLAEAVYAALEGAR